MAGGSALLAVPSYLICISLISQAIKMQIFAFTLKFHYFDIQIAINQNSFAYKEYFLLINVNGLDSLAL
jgi:hypothetical protein